MHNVSHFSQQLTHLWMDDAGTSFIEAALIGTLILVVVLLAALAWAKSA